MFGMRIFNSEGLLTLDIADRVPRLVRSIPFTISGNTSSIFISVPEIDSVEGFAAIIPGISIEAHLEVGGVTVRRTIIFPSNSPTLYGNVLVFKL